MVDDVLCVAKCSSEAVKCNATVNSFMELNKLKLASKKCAKIHIGKKSNNCPPYKIHEESLKESYAEKYLGDIICEKGTLDETIKQRKLKGYSYISEIRALLSDMPFGHRRVQVGLMLRDAMFANGILCNAEAWHNISKKHIEDLEVMDRSLLKYILKSHSKVQNEFLYLETGALGIKEIIMSRRCLYLQTILKRDKEELTKKIYNAQKKNPLKGDWILLVQKDFEEIGLDFDEEQIIRETKCEFKTRIKRSLRAHMFSELKDEQTQHSKISNICYQNFKMQEYLRTHKMNNHEVSLLFSLRSRSAKMFRANFPFYSDQNCQFCETEEDTQEHILKCEVIYPTNTRNSSIEYGDIFSEDVDRQAAITQLYATLIERREDASASTTGPSSCPGSPGQLQQLIM